MGDRALREAERAALRECTAEAEAAWLRQQLRTGHTTQMCVELAAYCGHAGARLLVTGKPADDRYCNYTWEAWDGSGYNHWFRGLRRWGRPIQFRAAVAAATAALPAWDERMANWRCPQCPRSGCACGAIADAVQVARAPYAAIPVFKRYLKRPDQAPSRQMPRFDSIDLPDFIYGIGMAIHGDQSGDFPEQRLCAAATGFASGRRTGACELAGEDVVRRAVNQSLLKVALASPARWRYLWPTS